MRGLEDTGFEPAGRQAALDERPWGACGSASVSANPLGRKRAESVSLQAIRIIKKESLLGKHALGL